MDLKLNRYASIYMSDEDSQSSQEDQTKTTIQTIPKTANEQQQQSKLYPPKAPYASYRTRTTHAHYKGDYKESYRTGSYYPHKNIVPGVNIHNVFTDGDNTNDMEEMKDNKESISNTTVTVRGSWTKPISLLKKKDTITEPEHVHEPVPVSVPVPEACSSA